jgi:hypothetical protein
MKIIIDPLNTNYFQLKPRDKKIMDAPRFIVNPLQRASLFQLKFIQKFNDRQIVKDDAFIRTT